MKPSWKMSLVCSALTASAMLTAPAVSPAAVAPSSWFQSGWNQSRTGYNPQESALTSANVHALDPAWFVPTPNGGGLDLTSVDSVGGRAYFVGGSGNELYSVDATTGATRWKRSTPGCTSAFSPPALHLGVLVEASGPCTTGLGYLSGYDAGTGRPLWTVRTGFSGSPPLTENGFVYLESYTASSKRIQIAALDVKTGKVKWQVFRPAVSGVNGFQLAADATHLYFSTTTYTQALNPSTGTVVWLRKVRGSLQVLVGSGHVIVAGLVSGGAGVITSFSPAGAQQWQAHANFNGIAADGQRLYLTRFTGVIQALDLATGTPGWHVTLPGVSLIAGQPAIAGGVVYVAVEPNDGGPIVYGLAAATGSQLWSRTFGAGDITQVSVAAGTLFVSANSAGVTALRP
jgi:outer membrane protein assembly factor BamB